MPIQSEKQLVLAGIQLKCLRRCWPTQILRFFRHLVQDQKRCEYSMGLVSQW
jgi:hypothetical protein